MAAFDPGYEAGFLTSDRRVAIPILLPPLVRFGRCGLSVDWPYSSHRPPPRFDQVDESFGSPLCLCFRLGRPSVGFSRLGVCGPDVGTKTARDEAEGMASGGLWLFFDEYVPSCSEYVPACRGLGRGWFSSEGEVVDFLKLIVGEMEVFFCDVWHGDVDEGSFGDLADFERQRHERFASSLVSAGDAGDAEELVAGFGEVPSEVAGESLFE